MPSHPDEARQSAISRTLAGDADWSAVGQIDRNGDAPRVAPIHWVTDDPARVDSGALLLDAVLLVAVACRLTTVALE